MERFSDPPVENRLAPFWFWNGDMDEKEIVHQVAEMAQQGLGGFFICARQGLGIAYLSDEWFQHVAVAIEAARRHGLHAWLYDENPYPSGMSGGEVTLQHPDARQRILLHQSMMVTGPQELRYQLPWAKVLSAQAVPLQEATDVPLWTQARDLAASIGSMPAASIFQSTGLTTYTNKRFFTAQLQKQLTWSAPAGRWLIVIFLEKEIDDFKYFGTYVDPCHKEAIQTFIATTHEQYARRFREHFGSTVKGLFTDEVGLLGRIPWSPRLPAFFRERYGEDLIDKLPALLYDVGERTAQIRYRFFQSVHLLLGAAYHQPVSNWCEQHGLSYLTEVPSVRMTTQIYSHIPGCDSAHEKVGRSLAWILERYACSLRANPKVVSSLARQLGHGRAMIECFHSVGWSMTLQDAKWMLDRLAAFGINLYVFHAFYYSISGLRKHDAPPSQFLQNPYWQHFRHLADYAARLSYVMSQGMARIPIAVVQPTTSFWTHLGNPFSEFRYAGNDPAEEQALERLKQDWAYVCTQLLLHQIDYDHLDPELLARAAIEDRQLVLGQARYNVLILPPMTNLEAAAWRRIEAFLQAGGMVIALGLLPYERIEAGQDDAERVLRCFGLTTSTRQHYWQASDTTEEVSQVAHWTKGQQAAYFVPSVGSIRQAGVIDQLFALVEQCVPPTVGIEPLDGGRDSLLMQQRSLPDGSQLIFIAHQEAAAKTLRLRLPQCAPDQIVERLDLTCGTVERLPVEQAADGCALLLSFAPYEAHLLRLPGKRTEPETGQAPLTVVERPWRFSLDMQRPWQLLARRDNSLRLADFHFALDLEKSGLQKGWHEGSAGQTWPLVEAKTLIAQCTDLASTQAYPLQFKQPFGVSPRLSLSYPLNCWYQTSFLVNEIPSTCALVMDEDAIEGEHHFYLNGERIVSQDFALAARFGHPQRSYDVRHLLKRGMNHLLIHVEASQDWHGVRDPLYLSGPFGVYADDSGMPIIGTPPETGIPHSDVQSGYPYYAGTLSFTREVELEGVPDEKAFTLTFQGWDEYIRDCVEVLLNGQSLGVCCWSPYRWSGESSLLRVGKNSIELRQTNTLGALLDGTYFDKRTHEIKKVVASFAAR